MEKTGNTVDDEGTVIYTPYIRKKDGTLVYPKTAKVFRIVVKKKRS